MNKIGLFLIFWYIITGCGSENNKQNHDYNYNQSYEGNTYTNILPDMQKFTEVCDRYGYVYYIGFRIAVPVTSPSTHKHMTCKEYRTKFREQNRNRI